MSDRKQCTKDSPMPLGDEGWWIHADAVEVDEDYGSLASGGSSVIYKCPNCNLRFRVQLPD